MWFSLSSTRRKSHISGELLLKFGVLRSDANYGHETLSNSWDSLVQGLQSHNLSVSDAIHAVPGNKSIGTSPVDGPPARVGTDDTDNGSDNFTDDDQSNAGSDRTSTGPLPKHLSKKHLAKLQKNLRHYEVSPEGVTGVVFLEIRCATDLPREKNGSCNVVSCLFSLNLISSHTHRIRHGSFCSYIFRQKDV